ncbi:MAG: hypothetical protein M1834_000428 [Cirrosporium novae-zelandiae]|nr:MAG: hypothetical protein M1834_000428 [Cirrosporium novae-zelandiae]
MSVVVLNGHPNDSAVSVDAVNALAADAGIKIPEKDVEDFRTLIAGLDHAAKEVLGMDDPVPQVDLNLYPRTDIHTPKDTDMGGWATKAIVTCTAPKTTQLQDKTLALKDNIALASVRCLNGNNAVPWTPTIDATVVTRILDASGTILGKAACENNCFGAVSDTAITGPVHNPHAPGYSAGGSSSGSARLVANGQVDMALGCDQGGSIRIPASVCGIVGLKPTWGLVPYTGIISLESTIDHVGPMTRTVSDTAILMDVIAGADGIDDRQHPTMIPNSLNFHSTLCSCLSTPKPLSDITIGVLEEGFLAPTQHPAVSSLVRTAIQKFASLGARIKQISIPQHTQASTIWMCALPLGGTRQGLLSDLTGRKTLYPLDRISAVPGPMLTQAAFDALGPGGQNIYLRGLWLEKCGYGKKLHAQCTNLIRKLTTTYQDVLYDECDVLVMPTLPSLPPKLLGKWDEGGVLERLMRTVGVTWNTCPFNSTGHPAISIPVGFAKVADSEAEGAEVKLPVGMQVVGSLYGDALIMRVAGAWESGRPEEWKKNVA